jgi:hypothetical protein
MIIRTLSLFLLLSTAALANDLDDGIDIDTAINDDLNLGKNVRFITRKALAKGKNGQKNSNSSGTCGSGNITIGPGSKVKEVINVSTNKGTTAVCGR